MEQLSGEQMFSAARRYYGACCVSDCTSQLWTIDSCAWVWQQVLVRACLTRLGLLRRTYLSAAAPPNANMPHRSPGFPQRTASRVCKWMFYIIILFHSGREEDETIKQSIYFLKIKLTLCASLCTVRCGIGWAWRGERTHICCHVTHTHTHTHTHPSLLQRPLPVLRMRVCVDWEEPPPDVAANEQLLLSATAARLIVNDTLAVALVTEKPPTQHTFHAQEILPRGARGSGVRPRDVGPLGGPVWLASAGIIDAGHAVCYMSVCVCVGVCVCGSMC